MHLFVSVINKAFTESLGPQKKPILVKWLGKASDGVSVQTEAAPAAIV